MSKEYAPSAGIISFRIQVAFFVNIAAFPTVMCNSIDERGVMNIYAYKTGHTFYTHSGAEKRNLYQNAQQRIHKNFEANRRSPIPTSSRERTSADIHAIITFFRGTVVNSFTGTIEWNTGKKPFRP